MAQKEYAGIQFEVNDEGYFVEGSRWNHEVAAGVAQEAGLTLSDKHLKVLDFLRERVAKGEALTIRSIGKSGIVDIKGFYELFPGAPLKLATKIAGLKKPLSCV